MPIMFVSASGYQSLMAKVYTYADNNGILISYSTCQSDWFKAEFDMILLDDWWFLITI